MRVTLKIDSATGDEMKRALLAWHFTADLYDPPKLALDGLVVKVCGSGYYVESPPIDAARAQQITEAARSAEHLTALKLWRASKKKEHA